MKDFKLARNIQTHWALPILGLLTAHNWFIDNITSPFWWLLIVFATMTGYVKR